MITEQTKQNKNLKISTFNFHCEELRPIFTRNIMDKFLTADILIGYHLMF